MSTDKARFEGDLVAIKEIIGNKRYETGKIFLKGAKILESLNHPNLVNFKSICYRPLAIMFQYVLFSFLLFPQFVKLLDWMGFLGFSIFLLKILSSSFFKTKFRFDWWLQFLHYHGIAHRYLKPANIPVSNKHYTNITDHAELNVLIKDNPQWKPISFGGIKVIDSLNKNSLSHTNQTYATWYAAFYDTWKISR